MTTPEYEFVAQLQPLRDRGQSREPRMRSRHQRVRALRRGRTRSRAGASGISRETDPRSSPLAGDDAGMSAVVTATPYDADGTWLVPCTAITTSPSASARAETSAIWPPAGSPDRPQHVVFIDSGVIRWLLESNGNSRSRSVHAQHRRGPPGPPRLDLPASAHAPRAPCYPTREHALAQTPAGAGPFAWPPPRPEAARRSEGQLRAA